jgi:hypothetical protein
MSNYKSYQELIEEKTEKEKVVLQEASAMKVKVTESKDKEKEDEKNEKKEEEEDLPGICLYLAL